MVDENGVSVQRSRLAPLLRDRWNFKLALVALLGVAGCLAYSHGQNYVGTYEVCRVEKGKLIDNNSLPPGQVMFAEIKKDGTFQMRDFLIGYEGKWRLVGKKLVVTIDNGPAGKLKTPDVLTFNPKPDRERLVIVEPKKLAGLMELHWDPKVIQKWNDRLSEIQKQSPNPSEEKGH